MVHMRSNSPFGGRDRYSFRIQRDCWLHLPVFHFITQPPCNLHHLLQWRCYSLGILILVSNARACCPLSFSILRLGTWTCARDELTPLVYYIAEQSYDHITRHDRAK